jgi:hypothetical protein
MEDIHRAFEKYSSRTKKSNDSMFYPGEQLRQIKYLGYGQKGICTVVKLEGKVLVHIHEEDKDTKKENRCEIIDNNGEPCFEEI